jgi:hypothetical protein
MCAIRLNWVADLPSGQAGVGQNERNPCFGDRVSVGEGAISVGEFLWHPGQVMRPVTGWLPVTGPVNWTGV